MNIKDEPVYAYAVGTHPKKRFKDPVSRRYQNMSDVSNILSRVIDLTRDNPNIEDQTVVLKVLAELLEEVAGNWESEDYRNSWD